MLIDHRSSSDSDESHVKSWPLEMTGGNFAQMIFPEENITVFLSPKPSLACLFGSLEQGAAQGVDAPQIYPIRLELGIAH